MTMLMFIIADKKKVYFIAVANTGAIVQSSDGGATLTTLNGAINAALNGNLKTNINTITYIY